MTTNYAAITPDTFAVAYADADHAEKARLRAHADAAMKACVKRADIGGAVAWDAARDAAVAAGKATVSTIDYAARVADLHATLSAAVAAIESGDYTMPDGVDAPTDVDFSTGTADAARVASLIRVTGRKTGRGSIVDYVTAVADATPRTATTLANMWADGVGGYAEKPSVGAIGAMFDRVIDGKHDDFVVTVIDGKKHLATA